MKIKKKTNIFIGLTYSGTPVLLSVFALCCCILYQSRDMNSRSKTHIII